MMKANMQPEELARFFHMTYEQLAPQFDYQTRKASAVAWEVVPENNKQLMIEVCRQVLARLREFRED
jgi:hypothetical protein